ncbi:uncharacterized protein AruCF_3030 [Achromobacter ruhlandii]|nr:uncharacterized protein AruCF_3030 [Achromobacter ruhlandii]
MPRAVQSELVARHRAKFGKGRSWTGRWWNRSVAGFHLADALMY